MTSSSLFNQLICFVTVRNELAKVMFLHLSVILFAGGGVCLSACWDTTPHPGSRPPGPGTPRSRHPQTRHPPDQAPPDQAPPRSRHPPRPGTPLADGYCCGWYVSYWNAFLLLLFLHLEIVTKDHTVANVLASCLSNGQELD